MKTTTALLILAALFLGLGFDMMSAGAAIFFAFVLAALAWKASQ